MLFILESEFESFFVIIKWYINLNVGCFGRLWDLVLWEIDLGGISCDVRFEVLV